MRGTPNDAITWPSSWMYYIQISHLNHTQMSTGGRHDGGLTLPLDPRQTATVDVFCRRNGEGIGEIIPRYGHAAAVPVSASWRTTKTTRSGCRSTISAWCSAVFTSVGGTTPGTYLKYSGSGAGGRRRVGVQGYVERADLAIQITS